MIVNMSKQVEISKVKKVLELTNYECFMELKRKDDPIADRLVEALLKKDIKERIEGVIYPHPAYIANILRDDDNAQLVTAARSEYIAAISDDETTTFFYIVKLC